MPGRPLAVKIYCAVVCLLVVVGVVLVSVPFLATQQPSTRDVVIGFTPLLVLLIFVWGVWRVRWWGVIGLTILIIGAEGWMLAMPNHQIGEALVRGAVWLLPLWWIAWRHRGQFK
jgi:hypothetical protein